MNLHELLSDERYDLPVPAGAVAEVKRRSSQVRRRRWVLLTVPALAAAVGVAPFLLGSSEPRNILYGAEPKPTASATQPPLAYQDPKAAVMMVCADRKSDSEDPYQFGLDTRLVTNDPIADCARLGHQNGYDVPLAAYATGHVSLVVVPAAWNLPAEFTRLPVNFRTDASRVAANLMFEDPIDGLSDISGRTKCLTEDQTRERAQDLLAEAGLADYDVQTYRSAPKANGATVCGFAVFPVEDSKTVLLIGHDVAVEGPAPSAPPVLGSSRADRIQRFVVQLRDRIAERCLDLANAQDQVAQAAASSGLTTQDFEVLPTYTGGDRCTRIDLQIAGLRLPVVLRYKE